MEITACVKAVVMAASQHNNNRSNSNMGYLLHQLEILQTVSARSESLKPLGPNELMTYECLTCLTDIIGNNNNKPALVLKALQILSNLAKDNELRNTLHESFNLDESLANILKSHGAVPEDHLIQECLQLMQRITYGHRVSFHEGFVEDLIVFLVKQILSPPGDITQSCLGILANLCRDNFPIQARIKSMDTIKKLYKTLCKFFTDQDLTTAVFSLTIFTSLSLNEDLGDKLFFNSQNIKQVLHLVFNVLVNGDGLTTRCYAVDLLQDLLRNPRLQQAIQEYTNLPQCIDDTLKLIATSTPQSVTKIFELLLSFCHLGTLRACICSQLFSGLIPPTDKLMALLSQHPGPEYSPLIATLYWATQPASAGNKASLTALDFMKEMCEELLCMDDQDLHPGCSLLVPVVVQILKEPLNSDDFHVKDSYHRMSKSFRLFSVLCSDDELKAALAETVKTQDFVTLIDKFLIKQTIYKYEDPSQNLGISGVEVVLLLMQVMTKIRRYVKDLDAFFLGLLQDNRMVPFLAQGLTSSDRDLVQISMKLTCFGTSLENFPEIILGDAVAAANANKSSGTTADQCNNYDDFVQSASKKQVVLHGKENMMPLKAKGHNTTSLSLQAVCADPDSSIQSLIEKMHSATELKDLKTADIMDIYEHRLQSYQTKEDHLQDLLEAKSSALVQADRLIAQYRSRQARHGAEAHKMRCLFQEAERKNECLLQELNETKLEKDRLHNDFELLKHEKNQLEIRAQELEELKSSHSDLQEKYEELESSMTRVQQELRTTKEMHELLQKHYESLKHQHDIASEQLKKLEDDRKHLSKQLKEKDSKLQETAKALQTLTDKHSRTLKDKEEVEQEKEELEKVTDRMRGNIALLEQTKKELQQKVKSMEALTQEQEESIKAYKDRTQFLESEVSKHAQIAALIHSLSSGKTPMPTSLPQ